MARSSLTITDDTAAALRRAKPALSLATQTPLTMDGCVAYLLRHWAATHPLGSQVPAAPAAVPTDRRARAAARA